MNPILIGLAIALAFSLLGNAMLGRAFLSQKEELASTRVELMHAEVAGQQCSEGVEQLQSLAATRLTEAQAARKKAADAAREGQSRAQQILSAPATVPGDACKSAGDRFDKWLEGRKP